jgi:voltage-gated potassium channel
MDRWLFIRTHVLALLVVAVPFLRPLRLLMLVAVVGQFIQRAKGGVRGRVLAFVLLATVVLMSTAAVLVYGFERTAQGSSIVTLGDAVWWAIATVTTVGYGDSIPVTPQGRTVAAVLMVVGIGLVGTLTAFVAAWFVQEQEEEDELAEQAEQAPMEATVRLLADRVAELQEEVARLRADLRREEG